MAKKYEAKDCCEISGKGSDDYKNSFLRSLSLSKDGVRCFTISDKRTNSDNVATAFFDNEKNKWIAGRYIGYIEDLKEKASITIKPRFGENILSIMFGELYNFKLPQNSESKTGNNSLLYIGMLICYIWQSELLKAGRHGLPRIKVSKLNRGYNVKGTLAVKPTMMSYSKSRMLISESREQVYDETIIAVLNTAYNILKKKFSIEKYYISPEARNLIKDIEKEGHKKRKVRITRNIYESIVYRPIYQNFKRVVDFSWQIINSSFGFGEQKGKTNISGYLIDMAEVWECYVRNILEKEFKKYGWILIDNEFTVYEGAFYSRKIIPDIVFQKGNKFCVFDAKYKRMRFSNEDVDRNDFFQIHTYISYLQQKGEVVAAGLIYPIEENKRAITDSLLFGSHIGVNFIIDGPIVENKGEGLSSQIFLEKISELIKD